MKTLLCTKNLCKSFTTGKVEQKVLKNLDLEIYDGDFTIIMGASGGGKSTLLYALSGMDKPTSGNIIFNNEDIANYKQDQLALFRRKNCGFVFQQIYLIDSMSILDNVFVSGLLVNKNKKELKNKSEAMLEKVGLEEFMWKKMPNMLSGGEAQRVGVARACINNPKILFADEPTGALNSIMAKSILDVFSKCNDDAQSIIMVTHDINSALRGNRILYLKDGVIEGELRLDKYQGEDESRRVKMKEFLEKFGW